jgi:hypothetical protein
MPRSRLFDSVKQRAKEAAQEFVSSERGAAAMAEAVRRMQGSRRVSTELVKALGLATQEDVERVSRKIGRLRKRLQAIADDLEQR